MQLGVPDFVPAFVARYERAYQSGVPLPWDLAGPTPFVVRLEAAGLFRGLILDSGCGTGENAIHLAGRGHRVVGADGAPTALARARERAAATGVTVRWMQTDVRDLPDVDDRFDTVLDSGLFHLLSEADQLRYATTLHRVCRAGALVHLFAMSTNPRNFDEPHQWEPSCGRNGTAAESIRGAFGAGWAAEALEQTSMDVMVPGRGSRIRYFWLARLRRGEDG
jgi:SAM-dependent methyltransferase